MPAPPEPPAIDAAHDYYAVVQCVCGVDINLDWTVRTVCENCGYIHHPNMHAPGSRPAYTTDEMLRELLRRTRP